MKLQKNMRKARNTFPVEDFGKARKARKNYEMLGKAKKNVENAKKSQNSFSCRRAWESQKS